jgi:uncharacterized protein (TIGR02246 family)
MKKLFYLIILVASTGMACNTAEDPAVKEVAKPVFNLTTARSEIEAVNKTFMELVTKGDSAGIAGLYTSDAKLMFPGTPAVSGTKNIEAVFGEIIRSGVTRVDLITKEVSGNEELLAEEEEVNIYVGDKIVAKDKALVLWKKENGMWKLFRDMTNSNSATN